MYVMGGKEHVLGSRDMTPTPVAPLPLCSEVFPFAQTSALDFVGNPHQYVTCKPGASILALKNVFTVEAVFFQRSYNQYQPIFLKSDGPFKNGFGLFTLNHPCHKGDPELGLRVHFFVGPFSLTGGQEVKVKIETEEWFHVAAVYNGKELKLYLNGTFKDQFDLVFAEDEEIHSKGDVLIGGYPGKYAWEGYIDECRLWDHERTEEQIRAGMNSVCTGVTPGLVGQWTFNEGCGEQIIDTSGQRNHGTFDRYAGGVELRRVQSSRPKIDYLRTEREKHIDANFLKLQKWKKDYEDREGRPPNKADIMLADPEILNIARRLGEI